LVRFALLLTDITALDMSSDVDEHLRPIVSLRSSLVSGVDAKVSGGWIFMKSLQ